ncbi:hypothetical protein H072_5269 [Dactylellina haptotyla CBS 200.50]|uniref:Uncharacterized protein n=1 Tax=Dactylellina haptotyla (strain CBS 200.50) TaxID=1284197 RepID=S8BZW1_DACHA|nr:hypothetical protein H072_5269 [Dactylellina haptotyla CBS 200.50]
MTKVFMDQTQAYPGESPTKHIDARLRALRYSGDLSPSVMELPSVVNSTCHPPIVQKDMDIEEMLMGNLSIEDARRLNIQFSPAATPSPIPAYVPLSDTGVPLLPPFESGDEWWRTGNTPPVPPLEYERIHITTPPPPSHDYLTASYPSPPPLLPLSYTGFPPPQELLEFYMGDSTPPPPLPLFFNRQLNANLPPAPPPPTPPEGIKYGFLSPLLSPGLPTDAHTPTSPLSSLSEIFSRILTRNPLQVSQQPLVPPHPPPPPQPIAFGEWKVTDPPPPPVLPLPSKPEDTNSMPSPSRSPAPLPPKSPIPAKIQRTRQAKPRQFIISDSPSPFLRLPRELRDQIYTLVLSFDTPKIPQASANPDFMSEYKHLSLDLSLLRACRQVHDEAAEIFYGHNTFVIRVVTQIEAKHVKVNWMAPWESLGYYYTIGIRPSEVVISGEDSSEDMNVIEEGTGDLRLPSRYRPLIRRLRIDIEDFRKEVFFLPKSNLQCRRFSDQSSQMMLIPLAERLKPILEAPGEKLKVHINIISTLLTPEQHLWEPCYTVKILERRRKIVAFANGIKMTDGANLAEGIGKVGALMQTFYQEMVRTAWPFTTGAWGYEIKMPYALDRTVFYSTDFILNKCNKIPGFDESDREVLRKLVLPDKYCWALRGGRLVAWNGKLGKSTVRSGEDEEPLFDHRYDGIPSMY